MCAQFYGKICLTFFQNNVPQLQVRITLSVPYCENKAVFCHKNCAHIFPREYVCIVGEEMCAQFLQQHLRHFFQSNVPQPQPVITLCVACLENKCQVYASARCMLVPGVCECQVYASARCMLVPGVC